MTCYTSYFLSLLHATKLRHPKPASIRLNNFITSLPEGKFCSVKTNLLFDSRRISQRLLVAASFGVAPLILGGCATLSEPGANQAAYRGPVTAGEVQDALARGVPQTELLEQIKSRGAKPPSSMEIDQLRMAGADHSVIDGLLKANNATQYVWVNPPRFSFYWGRGSWYWVNDFGWPVYPQPWGWFPDSPRFYGPHPRSSYPIKPSPRPKVVPQGGSIEQGKVGQGQAGQEKPSAAPPAPTPAPAQRAEPAYIPKNEK